MDVQKSNKGWLETKPENDTGNQIQTYYRNKNELKIRNNLGFNHLHFPVLQKAFKIAILGLSYQKLHLMLAKLVYKQKAKKQITTMNRALCLGTGLLI